MSDEATTKTGAAAAWGTEKHQAACQGERLRQELRKNILWKLSWNKLGPVFVKILVMWLYFNVNEKAEIFSWPGI